MLRIKMPNAMRKKTMLLTLLLAATIVLQAQVVVNGNAFGGGRKASVAGTTALNMEAGTVQGSLYGANDISGNVGSTAQVTVTGGTVGQHVFGGSNGYYGCNSENTYRYTSNFGLIAENVLGMAIPTVNHTVVTINGGSVVVNGSVYAGGNLAYVGNGSSSIGINGAVTNGNATPLRTGTATVNIYSGRIMGEMSGATYTGHEGNVFGGGNMASVFGTTTLTIDNTAPESNSNTLVINGAVYGGNDKLGAITSNATNGTTTASDGTSIAADVCYVSVKGTPTIGAVYGGGNGDYAYDGSEGFEICYNAAELANYLPVQDKAFVDINTTGGYIGSAFAGGNGVTVVSEATILLNATGNGTGSNNTHVGSLYGGNNKVDMTTVPTITLSSGKAGEVFGAGNMGGVLASTTHNGMTVSTVIEMNSNAVTVGNIYGSSNVTGTVQESSYISLTAGTVTGNVYGGANGDYGCNDGSVYTTNVRAPATAGMPIPSVSRTFVKVDGTAIGGSIYGGGNFAPIGSPTTAGSTEVVLESGNVASAFGGGNMATVYGTANIYTTPTSTITVGNLYGGNDKSGTVTGTGRTGTALDGYTPLTPANATAYVKVQGDPTIGKVFGAGNGDYTDAQYAAFGCNATRPTAASSYVDLNIGTSGSIGTSYGGGNAAGVEGNTTTVVNSENTLSTIYGGCRAADVGGNASVRVIDGIITDIYGGNDVAGTVSQASIELLGGATVENLYGGGNGMYYYANGNAYDYNNHSLLVKSGATARPYVENTILDLNAGTVNQNVYGGGKAGDVQNTNVTVHNGITLGGTLYGGGCGIVENIGYCTPHVGNVTGAANVTVVNLHDDMARIFAGGRSGDVVNTNLVIEESLNKHIGAVFGGCQASDLTGVANIVIGTPGTQNSTITIDTVYGGNDYSGRTQSTTLTVNSGTFTHLFGAGNGEYDYSRFRGQSNVCDTVPYSMNIDIVINGGNFTNTVYGGGNLGLVGHKDITWNNYPEGSHNSNLYGYINMDVHGGYFTKHIFLGARGSMTRRKFCFGFNDFNHNPRYQAGTGKIPGVDEVTVLAYAYKQFNMDGGYVDFSVYGGSEAVDDGFPYECWDSDPTRTSTRPTSVLNIVGGTINNRVYGAGYRGNVYGSVYVNVGSQAVEESPVWTRQVGRMSGASRLYPVTFDRYRSRAMDLNRSPLFINNTIYNGSDWGEAGTSQYLTQRGFFGGLGLIYIDGTDYQTSLSQHSTNPVMEITGSLIGSGTSTAPADINSRITVKNYGDYYCPTPSRVLKSIQRTNRLYLENTYITLEGYNDAYNAHATSQYAIARIDSIIFHSSNLVECEESSEYIGMVRSEDENSVPYTNETLYSAVDFTCHDESMSQMCNLLYGELLTRNTLLLNNGIYFSISPFVDNNSDHTDDNADALTNNDHAYGYVDGYLYMLAPIGTQSYAYAGMDQLPRVGGFVAPCESSNTRTNGTVKEIDYTSTPVGFFPAHRTWGVGTEQGDRKRRITIVAHKDPNKVVKDHYMPGTDNQWAYANATLTLPPSEDGHYYTIHSVVIDDANGGQMRLTDNTYDETTNSWWSPFSGVTATEAYAKNLIENDPAFTFGLMFSMGDFFDNTASATIATRPSGFESSPISAKSVISGNNGLTQLGGFLSSPISTTAEGILPTINFTLAYNLNMDQSMARDVVFTMYEYDANANYVGPVEVTLTISTIIDLFSNQSATLLAMYNEGTSNTYERKVVIPASFVQREIYLTNVSWEPTHAQDQSNSGRFNIQNNTAPVDNYKKFSLTVSASEDITESNSSTLGWYRISPNAYNLDLYAVAGAPAGQTRYTYSANLADTNSLSDVRAHALNIGILDGRSVAAFDFKLGFNGSMMYEDEPDLGRFVLTFVSIDTYDETTANTATITVQVRTRQKGDTIYMAEPTNFFCYADGYVDTLGNATAAHGAVATRLNRFAHTYGLAYEKNDPLFYFPTFQQAMEHYDEGDAICILDTIHIDNPDQPITINGSKSNGINVIRYSGSHFRWPGPERAYYGPLVKISNGAKFTLSKVNFNGSGCSYVATPEAGTQAQQGFCSTLNNYANPGDYAIINGKRYNYLNSNRDTLFASAPAIWVEDNSVLKLSSSVNITNNYNRRKKTSVGDNDTCYLGGAIGMQRTAQGSPTVTLATNSTIKNNLVSDYHTSCNDIPRNYGAGVFVNGGQLIVGNNKAGNLITVDNNYYMPSAMTTGADANFINSTQVAVTYTNGTTAYRPVFRLRNDCAGLHKSNVYLTRTAPTTGTDAELVANDGTKSDVVSVGSQLSPQSRIGISKWFPGFVARDGHPRDTIAVVDYSATSALAAAANYQAGVFTDDSATYRDYDCSGTIDDDVDLRQSPLLSHYKIFLHRCASFRPTPSPLTYELNPDVICPGDGDVMHFAVQGGSASYTFNWYSSNDNGATYTAIPNSLSVVQNPVGSYTLTNFSLGPNESEKIYYMRVVAEDAGGCRTDHDMEVVVKQAGIDMESGSISTTGIAGGKFTDGQPGHLQSTYLANWIGHTDNQHAFEVPGMEYAEVTVGDKTKSRVVRLYTYYRLNWQVNPVAGGTITAMEDGLVVTPNTHFCPGDVVELTVTPIPNWELVMWDYDPSASNELDYVVSNVNETVTAYVAPSTYWYQTVTASPGESSYSVGYHGDVTIKDANGLAWFISTVNGLNGQSAENFIFDTITIKAGTYNMSSHKWTPLGNSRNPFRGYIQAEEGVTISGIIVSEEQLPYVGLFGVTDSARIHGINLANSTIRGNSYGGGLIGYASDSTVIEGATISNTTVSASNAVGGLAGKAENATMYNNYVDVQLVGNTLYGGGLAGHATRTTTSQNAIPQPVGTIATQDNNSNTARTSAGQLSALYLGGVFGYSQGVDNPTGGKNSVTTGHIQIKNNYVELNSNANSLYVGGLAGYATTTDMENNYAYGAIKSLSATGGLMGRVGSNVNVNNCYYADGYANTPYGAGTATSSDNVTTFSGAANQVAMAEPVEGVDNLTRALNIWVRDAGGSYKSWRSDFETVNHGYPIFGEPDRIPIYDTIAEVVCDSFEIDGTQYTTSGIYSVVVPDTVNFVDSTLVVLLTVNYSQSTEITDTVLLGDSYYGNGFALTADEIKALVGGDSLSDLRLLQLADSLMTEQGCDSIIVLNLMVKGTVSIGGIAQQYDVKVYPNPTLGRVNIDADGLLTVEVYDALSRKVKTANAIGNHCEIDLDGHATGTYYLRIHTEHGVAVQKVMKQ